MTLEGLVDDDDDEDLPMLHFYDTPDYAEEAAKHASMASKSDTMEKVDLTIEKNTAYRVLKEMIENESVLNNDTMKDGGIDEAIQEQPALVFDLFLENNNGIDDSS
ncbi:hypothetical protein VTP01DRAFT_585 [Rhizomucor pusillus]|uniref:uncharacterized protein n=1 Tax=Rhizomucor pusillus TaxID=4840 RepID=UPI0037445D7C